MTSIMRLLTTVLAMSPVFLLAVAATSKSDSKTAEISSFYSESATGAGVAADTLSLISWTVIAVSSSSYTGNSSHSISATSSPANATVSTHTDMTSHSETFTSMAGSLKNSVNPEFRVD
jgi:hypothetical protein